MVERHLKIYHDLLLSTPNDTDFESRSKGSYHPTRECNMLHHSENGAAATEAGRRTSTRSRAPSESRRRTTRNAWSGPRHERPSRATNGMLTDAPAHSTSTPKAHGCGHDASMNKFNRVKGKHLFSLERQNIATAAMLMRTAPEPSTNEGRCVHKELLRPARSHGDAAGLELHGEAALRSQCRSHLHHTRRPQGVPSADHTSARKEQSSVHEGAFPGAQLLLRPPGYPTGPRRQTP